MRQDLQKVGLREDQRVGTPASDVASSVESHRRYNDLLPCGSGAEGRQVLEVWVECGEIVR